MRGSWIAGGGTPELIGENERGLLFENGDADELCAQLQNLIGDEDLRRTLSIRAAQFANEHLNLGIALERQSEIMNGSCVGGTTDCAPRCRSGSNLGPK